jgi:uridine phosphorylase
MPMPPVDDAIVRPIKGRRSPELGPLAFLIATALDLTEIRRRLVLPREESRHLFTSRMWQTSQATIVGPMVGAPYAVMVLETLISWGARRFLFLGWCGALVETLQIGDILLPDSAIVDEGTSGHYRNASQSIIAEPSVQMNAEIQAQIQDAAIPSRSGRVWSTDGVFRETPEKVRRFTRMGAQSVDMETSALFTVAAFRRVDLAALLVVSDTLAGMRWQHGFRTEAFARGRSAALDVVLQMLLRPNQGER